MTKGGTGSTAGYCTAQKAKPPRWVVSSFGPWALPAKFGSEPPQLDHANRVSGQGTPNTDPNRFGRVRDRFGQFGLAMGERQNSLRLFGFRHPKFGLRGPHNPLVAGSSPAGPTNSIAFNGLWPMHRETIVPRWVSQCPPLTSSFPAPSPPKGIAHGQTQLQLRETSARARQE